MPYPYQIFISYRRDGGGDLARLMKYTLTDRGFKVFLDVESLRAGRFNEALFERIAECTDVLVILPPNGLDRCIDPNDWVRLEVARALQLEKNVIPIITRNFEFPKTLPEDIESLQHMNGINASNEYFDAAIEKLISRLLRSTPLNSEEHLLREVKEGNISAMNDIGLLYELGSEELLQKKMQGAFAFYEKSAKSGNLGALYNLGDIYEKCEKDLSLVYDYGIEEIIFQKSINEAREILHNRAVDCYTKAAEKSFAPAIYRLGNLAEDSLDFKKAVEFYEKAANLNYPAAQNALGYYKMKGIKTDIDIKSAIILYEQAANAGYLPAIYNYAHAMESRDTKIAIEFYERLIGLNPRAAFNLAHIYECSIHDLRCAINYYRIAYEEGFQEAEEGLKRCQDMLWQEINYKMEN